MKAGTPRGSSGAPKGHRKRTICRECVATLAVRDARAVDSLERASRQKPRRPWPDDSFAWLILQAARINGIELCTSATEGDGTAEGCTFCKYRRRRYDTAPTTSLVLKRSPDPGE